MNSQTMREISPEGTLPVVYGGYYLVGSERRIFLQKSADRSFKVIQGS